MDPIELTKKSTELSGKDEKFKESIKDITTSLLLDLTNGEERFLHISINQGNITISEEKKESEFVIEMKMSDYNDLLLGKTSGLELMAFGKLKLTKGSLEGIGKIASAFSSITDFSQKVLESEK